MLMISCGLFVISEVVHSLPNHRVVLFPIVAIVAWLSILPWLSVFVWLESVDCIVYELR